MVDLIPSWSRQWSRQKLVQAILLKLQSRLADDPATQLLKPSDSFDTCTRPTDRWRDRHAQHRNEVHLATGDERLLAGRGKQVGTTGDASRRKLCASFVRRSKGCSGCLSLPGALRPSFLQHGIAGALARRRHSKLSF